MSEHHRVTPHGGAGMSVEERLERLDRACAPAADPQLPGVLRARISRHRTAQRRTASTALACVLLLVGATAFRLADPSAPSPPEPTRDLAGLGADADALDSSDVSRRPLPVDSPVTLQLELVRRRLAALAAPDETPTES